jgi:hypothetical protein
LASLNYSLLPIAPTIAPAKIKLYNPQKSRHLCVSITEKETSSAFSF